MKFPGYFLIVADFIKWAKAEGIPVGPGRGSGAGSLVAYSLTITDLDPLRFGLLFERFLNPERISMPDFDIDFCQDRRDEVIRYVQEKYGDDRVAQIITYGKLQARAVLRDVGRVLQMPYGQVDRLCKLVPEQPRQPGHAARSDRAASRACRRKRDADPMVARLLDIAQRLEGLYRHASTHAAGMVIGDRPLDRTGAALPRPQVKFSDHPVQLEVGRGRRPGEVRLPRPQDADGAREGVEADQAQARASISTWPSSRSTTSRATSCWRSARHGRRVPAGIDRHARGLRKLKPDRFEDIIAMVALYRPGPMDNIPTYINRKHGEEPVDCLHPMLEDILEETYGVIIYQEQVMQIAQVHGRLLARRSRPPAPRDGQEGQGGDGRAAGAVRRRRGREGREGKARRRVIFELVDKFAGYGFNKSHAAAYALVSYQTAYLKANYREEFLAASMTLDMGNTDKLAVFAAEAKRSGIEVKPPCVNEFGSGLHRRAPECGDGRCRCRPLCPRRPEEHRGRCRRDHRRTSARANGRFADLSDFARRLDPPRAQQARP